MGSAGSLPSSYCQAWPQQRHPPQHLFPPLLPQQPGTSWESKVPSQVEGQGSKGLTGKPRVSWWRSLDWRGGLHNGELYTTHALKNRHTTRSATSGLGLTSGWFNTRSTWKSERDGSIRETYWYDSLNHLGHNGHDGKYGHFGHMTDMRKILSTLLGYIIFDWKDDICEGRVIVHFCILFPSVVWTSRKIISKIAKVNT